MDRDIYSQIISKLKSISEKINAMSQTEASIGDLTELETTNKSTLVAAINEVVGNLDDAVDSIGELSDLDTTDKTSIVNAVNEVVSSVEDVDDKIKIAGYLTFTDDVVGSTITVALYNSVNHISYTVANVGFTDVYDIYFRATVENDTVTLINIKYREPGSGTWTDMSSPAYTFTPI